MKGPWECDRPLCMKIDRFRLLNQFHSWYPTLGWVAPPDLLLYPPPPLPPYLNTRVIPILSLLPLLQQINLSFQTFLTGRKYTRAPGCLDFKSRLGLTLNIENTSWFEVWVGSWRMLDWRGKLSEFAPTKTLLLVVRHFSVIQSPFSCLFCQLYFVWDILQRRYTLPHILLMLCAHLYSNGFVIIFRVRICYI